MAYNARRLVDIRGIVPRVLFNLKEGNNMASHMRQLINDYKQQGSKHIPTDEDIIDMWVIITLCLILLCVVGVVYVNYFWEVAGYVAGR